jgi:hypothetical protein
VLLKLVTLIGAPPVIVAVSALAKAEAGDKGREEVENQSERSVLSGKWYVIQLFIYFFFRGVGDEVLPLAE